MRILLTGASGFIGTNLLEDLISKGYEVLNIDWKEPKMPARKKVWVNVAITAY
ncbi:MAG: NAD(P)-dependent oxidoreductase, partial [Clostridia bacterium]|nr:NAD(P)-dependent oxidoreductase [Clostridia bacterium]